MNPSGKNNLKWRYIAFIAILFLMFVYLTSGLVNLQLRQSEEYATEAEDKRTKTITLRGKRGNITDADSVILAEDELIYNVTFYKDASQTSRAQYLAFSQSIVDTIEIIERNGGELCISFVIQRNEETGEWEFNFGSGVSDSVLAKRETQWRSNNYLTSMNSYDTADKCIDALKRKFRLANTPEERQALLDYDISKGYVDEQGNGFVDCLIVDEATML